MREAQLSVNEIYLGETTLSFHFSSLHKGAQLLKVRTCSSWRCIHTAKNKDPEKTKIPEVAFWLSSSSSKASYREKRYLSTSYKFVSRGGKMGHIGTGGTNERETKRTVKRRKCDKSFKGKLSFV